MDEVTFNELPQAMATLLKKMEHLEAMVADIQNAVRKPREDWMSMKDLLEYLPMKASKSSIYKMVFQHEIPHFKRGNRLYFKRSQIDAWLSAWYRKTDEELRSEAALYCLRHPRR